jgi:hypothetical protein
VKDPVITARDRYPSHWHWQGLRQTIAPEPAVTPAPADSHLVLRTLAALAVILVLLLVG